MFTIIFVILVISMQKQKAAILDRGYGSNLLSCYCIADSLQ